ncbi:MAG: tRNA preQ1(34) S-adenosylmethionine ribosyltransferase-isomerase QueA [Chloroflexi bacterium RBG_16_50_11]|nr:MAG: tRNA preQ1(34) S-adenosylmethionine ribosyltransferase-isomerase QueA [Chloroflexi bacterium RBG_16_50_11]
MRTSDFDYTLPQELIAQTPIEPRDHSRLLVLNRQDASIEHRHFFDIVEYLHAGDVMVFNDSRVIPARIKGKRVESGGGVEILLLRRLEPDVWETLVKPARRLNVGAEVEIRSNDSLVPPVIARITAAGIEGIRTIHFTDEAALLSAGEMPLPPYIHTHLENPDRYQTVYARDLGSAAAPTAGLHFTPALLAKIERQGVRCLFTTLHVGLDTFRPVTEDNPLEHTIHREYGIVPPEVAEELTLARHEGRRIICIGTTSVRLTEQAALNSPPGVIQPFNDWVSLFILPGHQFSVVDAMVTNFHLPKSTLIMLVTAFAGKELIDKAYCEAIGQKYRFYSFGDAMLII